MALSRDPSSTLARGSRADLWAWRELLGIGVPVGIFVILAVSYVWFATEGTWRYRDTASAYFDALGVSFLHGRLFLPNEVPPALVALANPYDPDQRSSVTPTWPWDSSLYKGRLYLYWGPAPAILHAIWHLHYQLPLSEGQFSVYVALATCVAAWLLFWRLRRSLFPNSPVFVVWGSLLSFGFGGMLPYLLGRPSVYHSPILLAMFGLVAGLACLAEASGSSLKRRACLCLAGGFLGWAIASRITYVAYAAAIGLVVVWVLFRAQISAGRAVRDITAFGAPLVVAVVALLGYNWARFDSPFEFGQRYQLAGTDQTHVGLTCGTNLIGYVSLYFLSVPRLETTFPYVPFRTGPALEADTNRTVVFPPLRFTLTIPEEPPIISALWLAPIGVLIASAFWLRSRLSVLASAGAVLVAALLGLVFTTGVLTCANGVDARYFGDLTPALSLAGSIVLLAWADRLATALPSSPRRILARRGLYTFAAAAWIVTIATGVLLGRVAWLYPV